MPMTVSSISFILFFVVFWGWGLGVKGHWEVGGAVYFDIYRSSGGSHLTNSIQLN